MIEEVFSVFISVLGRAALFLFDLPVTSQVSVGSFLVAAGVMSVMIGVVFAGIRSMVAFNNDQERRSSRRMKSNE